MKLNLMIFECLLILTSSVLAQYNGVKPDVTFGDYNDRFDVSDLMAFQNKYFRADGSVDYRRRHGGRKRQKYLRTIESPNDKKWLLGSERGRKKFAQRIKKETEEQLNKLANIILLRMKSMRRTGEDFAYHDNMESGGGDVYDFNESLAAFQKVTRRPQDEQNVGYRRIGADTDMFNYAFPIDMEVKGYLVPPVN